MNNNSWLILGGTTLALCISSVGACNPDNDGELLTVVTVTNVSSSSAGGGNAVTTTGEGGGTGGMMATSSSSSAGGAGQGGSGTGGTPPDPVCGDGTINGDPGPNGEECDDGNLLTGDGCDNTCKVESGGWVCQGDSPSFCSLHGCTEATALDATLTAPPIAITYPSANGQPICMKIKANTQFDFVVTPPEVNYRVSNSWYDEASGAKNAISGMEPWSLTPLSGLNPQYHYCPLSPYDCADCPAFMLSTPGAYPFLNDKSPSTISTRGVLFIVP